MAKKSEASIAWDQFRTELACVDDEYLRRAFEMVWLARGIADKMIAVRYGSYEARAEIVALDKPPWEETDG